jgi:hypothetical protein
MLADNYGIRAEGLILTLQFKMLPEVSPFLSDVKFLILIKAGWNQLL